jgi:hypothetical protein
MRSLRRLFARLASLAARRAQDERRSGSQKRNKVPISVMEEIGVRTGRRRFAPV